MNLLIVIHVLCAIMFACATNTTNETVPVRRFEFRSGNLVDMVRQEVIEAINSLWRNMRKTRYSTSDVNIIHKFENINHKVKKAQAVTRPNDLLLFGPSWTYTLMDAEIAKLNELYKEFERFYKSNKDKIAVGKKSWIALAKRLKDKSTGIPLSLQMLRKYIIIDKESENVFSFIQKQAKQEVCSLKKSPHQTIYNLHNIISLTEIKAYVLMQFAYLILTVFNDGNFKKLAESELTPFENATTLQINRIRQVMPKASRSFYLCDPQKFEEGVTHTRITKLLQGYIENERNMHDHGFCTQKCHDYDNAKYITCFKRGNEFCKHQPQCRGKIFKCKFYKKDMSVCISKDPTKRYDWVDFDGGPILGKKSYCDQEHTYRVNSWERLFTSCDYCVCLCDEGTWSSDRYFNLRDVTSDVEENMVVTGLRIIKRKRIIHLQIQQAVLLPHGNIDKSTVSWKPVVEYSLHQTNVSNGVDYHIMDHKDRGIDLNELYAPVEHVLTGVRFRKWGSFVSLGIRVTPFNFETGRLSGEQSYWKRNSKTRLREIKLNEPDVPTRKGPHYLVSSSNQFIKFQPTSFKTDFAQTTVPYLDSQEITLDFPLSGAGLIFRGARGSGGFVAPKLITYDYGKHLNF